MDLTEISNHIHHLAEGPLWHKEDQKLYWTDILSHQIWKYNPENKQTSLVWQGTLTIGGFAFTKKGGIVMCTDKGVFLLSQNDLKSTSSEPKKILDVPMDKGERFNDITTDPIGRIYAGTKVSEKGTGKLYLLEKGKAPKVMLTGLTISNGMAFSMDEKYLFHTDSPKFSVTRYEYDIKTGDLKNPEIFYKGEEKLGYPDGITIDTEDYIWIAFWGASKVRRIAPDGKLSQEIEVPAIQPSSVVFGGANMDQLFITSACEDAVDIKTGLDGNGNFLGGKVYCAPLKVHGRYEWLADVDE